MKLYYIANARMPTEKAHGIQIAKMCEALLAAGVDLTLVVPRRAHTKQSVRDFYGLSRDIPLVVLPAFAWWGSTAGFVLSSLSFMLSYNIFLFTRMLRREKFVLYSVDMDTFSFAPLRLFGQPYFCEMHSAKPATLLTQYFFAKTAGIIAVNREVAAALADTFALPSERLLPEPNGVDLSLFAAPREKAAARKELGISPQARVALYVGRFYEWKELGILVDAARLCPDVEFLVVGGSTQEFCTVTGRQDLPENLRVLGECPQQQVPVWLAAADVLLVLGTRKNEVSYRYTAPMKVYEYMAAWRPIVASNTPALHSIVGDDEVVWYEPDEPQSLVEVLQGALEYIDPGPLGRASARAREHTWDARAARVMRFIAERAKARTARRAVMLEHDGGELANQLWNFMSIYAYCCERGYQCENWSFFEYAHYFSPGMLPRSRFLRRVFFVPFAGHAGRRSSQRSRLYRRAYKLLVALPMRALKGRSVVFSREAKGVYALPPSVEPSEHLAALEGEKGSIYFANVSGGVFRNPLGLQTYRPAVLEHFAPARAVEQKVQALLLPIRQKYAHVVGVHIRQGDYAVFKGGRYLIAQPRVREILDEYLRESGKKNSETCFVICSDGIVDEHIFDGLNVVLSKNDAGTDLFTLAQCGAVIGSDSTFGNVAAYLGNIPHLVMTNAPLDWEYYAGKKTYFENKYCTMLR